MGNPICSCLVMTPKPKNPCDSNCIYAPSLLVADQMTACDGTQDIDISAITAACDDNIPKYTIISYTNVTGTPTITSDKITFTPANNDYKPAEIRYKVSCGMYSATGKVIIVYKNTCIDVTCTDSKVCNKCTGMCEDVSIDFSTVTADVVNEENTSGFII